MADRTLRLPIHAEEDACDRCEHLRRGSEAASCLLFREIVGTLNGRAQRLEACRAAEEDSDAGRSRYWEVARAACPDLPSSLGNTDHDVILQVIEDARKVPDAMRRAFHEAEAERDRLAALIEQAPHAQHCGMDHLRPDGAPSRCDCWKSRTRKEET